VIRLDESRPHCGGVGLPPGFGFAVVIRLDESRPHCGRYAQQISRFLAE